jgi:hypothetical protein
LEDDGGVSAAQLLPQLLTHLGSDAILQLLIGLCIGEPAPSEPGMPVANATTSRDELAAQSWLPHATLIPAALDALDDSNPEVSANASSLLCALLAASSEPPECLEGTDGGHERCAQLVRACLGPEVGDPPNLPALKVVLQLLGRARDSPGGSPVADSILVAIEADVERFFAAVAAPSPLPARFARFFSDETPAYRPRGQQRCEVLLLLEYCLKSERAGLTTPLLELGLFGIIVDLLVAPHTCNALHLRAAAILEWAISHTAWSSPELATAVRRSLLVDAKLTERLLALVDEHTPPPPPEPPAADGGETSAAPAPTKRAKPLPCCHVFVMHIGACLLSAAQREPEFRPLLDAVPGWNRFIAPGGALTTWEALQSKPLGGTAPTRASDSDSDDDDELDATTMERVLAAQANSLRNSDALSGDGGDGHDDDDEDGHSSEYLQHFAHYLSNRNFLNQTSDDVHDLNAMAEQLPPPPSEAWTAEFDLEDFEGDASGSEPAPAPSDGGGGATTGDFASFDELDADSGGGGGNGALTGDGATPPPPPPFAAEFEVSSSSSAADADGWAAFDAPPPTGPDASEAPSVEGAAEEAPSRISRPDPELSI